jgi:deoxyadenosine/deoxycytidine kinase
MTKKKSLIEVCGGIAAGKTTLVQLFKRNDLLAIFEDFKKSPFWQSFYLNPGKYIFETEISFALLHYHQIKNAIGEKQTDLICDFSFLLDLAYARIGLFGSQLKAFECVLDEIRNELPGPELYIYLDCNAETQLERIKSRKRPEESLITIDFLESLNKALRVEIDNVDPKRVITINSAEKDFANIETVQNETIKVIKDALSN